MSAGRKRKPGKRTPGGRLKRCETERDAMATALLARQRHYGLTAGQARDERLGSALGRLAFSERISNSQYQAGLAFADLYQIYHSAMGLPCPTPRSSAGILTSEGIFGASPSELMLDSIDRLKHRFEQVKEALDQCDREQLRSLGCKPGLLVFRVICADEDCACTSQDLGNLRLGLNALARVFRLERSPWQA